MAHTCPVCAYPGLDEPTNDITGEPTYAICPCCGTQFGADDLVRTHDELRADWIAGGALWWSEVTPPPPSWSAATQLAAVGHTAAIPPVASG